MVQEVKGPLLGSCGGVVAYQKGGRGSKVVHEGLKCCVHCCSDVNQMLLGDIRF